MINSTSCSNIGPSPVSVILLIKPVAVANLLESRILGAAAKHDMTELVHDDPRRLCAI
jgi:hypothetical protein